MAQKTVTDAAAAESVHAQGESQEVRRHLTALVRRIYETFVPGFTLSGVRCLVGYASSRRGLLSLQGSTGAASGASCVQMDQVARQLLIGQRSWRVLRRRISKSVTFRLCVLGAVIGAVAILRRLVLGIGRAFTPAPADVIVPRRRMNA